MFGSRKQKLAAIAGRLVQLLKESDNPHGEMVEIERRFYDAGLADWTVPAGTSPHEFAATIIEENPLLYDVIDDVTTIFNPELIETPEELISHIIPVLE